jgi:hypothetical protein
MSAARARHGALFESEDEDISDDEGSSMCSGEDVGSAQLQGKKAEGRRDTGGAKGNHADLQGLFQKNPRNQAASSSSPSSMPHSASTPVTSHFDAILECLDLLRLMESDVNVSKQDVVDSIRSMHHNMLSTIMMHSFSTSMSVKGWRVE